jgi:hypothetical protein
VKKKHLVKLILTLISIFDGKKRKKARKKKDKNGT